MCVQEAAIVAFEGTCVVSSGASASGSSIQSAFGD